MSKRTALTRTLCRQRVQRKTKLLDKWSPEEFTVMSYLRTGMCLPRLWCLNHSNLHHFRLWLWLKCQGNPICSSATGLDLSPAISCLKHQFVFITINSNLFVGNLRDFSCEKWLFHQQIHVHSRYVVCILCQWVTTKTRNLDAATDS